MTNVVLGSRIRALGDGSRTDSAAGGLQATSHVLRRAFVAGFIAVSVFCLAAYVATMALGFHMLYLDSRGAGAAGEYFQQLYVYIFFMVGLRLPWPVNIRELFSFLWLLFAACLVTASLGPRRSWTHAVKGSLSGPFWGVSDNYLLSMPILANMLLFAVEAISNLQEAYGIPTGSIYIQDPFTGIVELSYAALVEEVAFRIMPLGSVVLFEVLVLAPPPKRDWRYLPLAFLHPEGAKRRSGLGGIGERGLRNGPGLYEWAMLLLSSALFAAAHLLSNIGWQTGKLTTTFVSGIVMGLLYLYYGAASPILLHWFFNYHSVTLDFAVGLYGQPISTYATLVSEVIRMTGGLAWLTVALYLFCEAFHRSRPRTVPA